MVRANTQFVRLAHTAKTELVCVWNSHLQERVLQPLHTSSCLPHEVKKSTQQLVSLHEAPLLARRSQSEGVFCYSFLSECTMEHVGKIVALGSRTRSLCLGYNDLGDKLMYFGMWCPPARCDALDHHSSHEKHPWSTFASRTAVMVVMYHQTENQSRSVGLHWHHSVSRQRSPTA